MIIIKTPDEIELMRKSGEITRDVLALVGENVKEGVSTYELDKLAYDYIVSCGAKPSFKGYGGFPGSICTSIDEVVVHGIPSKTEILKEGQIISIDAGAILNGYHSDAARTFAVGKISKEKAQLVEVTKESFFRGIEQLKVGNRLGDVSHAIQEYCESFGYASPQHSCPMRDSLSLTDSRAACVSLKRRTSPVFSSISLRESSARFILSHTPWRDMPHCWAISESDRSSL